MSNRPANLKYLVWFGLLTCCVFLFFAEANRNSLFSIPIEVFPILLAALLVAAAYILKLNNKIFKFFLWLGLLASTASIAWFILLQMVYPYGTEVTITLYSIAALITAWLQFKKSRAAPN
jgi:hypothetical protein